jgi:predicted nucleotidyltransferase
MFYFIELYSAVAQPVEHPAVNGRVLGSIPSRGASKKTLCIKVFLYDPNRVQNFGILQIDMSEKIENPESNQLKEKAEITLQKAKELILHTIPNDEIISIYVKGSFVQGELLPSSDVDVVVILKSEEYLPTIYDLTKQYGDQSDPPFQIVCYTLKELKTGEKASNRIRNTTAVSRFVKHIDSLPLIYGTKPEGKLFTRTDEKDLSISIKNFTDRFIPEYKEGKFGFKELVKQVLWLIEGEQRLKQKNIGYSWQKLADSISDQNHIIHSAFKYRKQNDISKTEKDEFLRKLEEHLNSIKA